MSDHNPQSNLSRQRAVKLVHTLLLALAVGLVSGGPVDAKEPQSAQGGSAASTPLTPTPLPAGEKGREEGSVMKLNLAECLSLALQQQPRVAAQRASLAAAEDNSRSLEALRLVSLLDPEIRVRRRQACLGVTAASAGLDRAEREAAHAVTRTYITVLFAREQERTAAGIIERLTALRDTAQRAVDAGDPNVTVYDVKRTAIYVRLAETQRIQAAQGVQRAVLALKEAIGLGSGAAVEVPPGLWTEPQQRPNHDDVVAWALARRGELVQASVFVDVTCLEVEAQGTCCMVKRMDTFAAATDIHALQVPQGVNNAEYRPGAVAPEMPVSLAGSRQERMKRALDFNVRASAGLSAARNLITLEAEDAFLRWEQAVRQVAEARDAADNGDKFAEDLTKDFTARLKVKIEDVINARVLAAQTRGQYNEFLYKELLALAELERVTAGGFSAGLVELTNPPSQPAQEKSK